MDSKTRVQLALAHQKPDRVPFNFWMDRRLMARYEQRFGHRHWRVTHYGADVIESFVCPQFPAGPGIEHNGTWWQTGPLFTSWTEAPGITLPDPQPEELYILLKRDLTEFPDTAIFLNTGTPFSVIAGMRSYETIYMDLIDYADDYHALARRIADVQNAVAERVCTTGITALYIQEDLATTKGLAMSPAMINEFCLKYAKEQADIAHAHNLPVVFHSDGMIMDLIPLLQAIGVNAVNPLQPHLNDAKQFKNQYGDTTALYGGLDNCFIILNETPAEIRQHVLDLFDTVGKPDGGLILSSHDIPLDTPEENIEALVRTITQECRYD